MLNVACVLRSSKEKKYRVEDVLFLQRMVKQNLAEPFVFTCLSDMYIPYEHDVRWVPLAKNWPGWWSKIELFQPGVFYEGDRILYFDLDTAIVGSLETIAAREEAFLAIGDFYRRPPKEDRIKLASGMMMWTAGGFDYVYEAFTVQAERLMKKYTAGGDQLWIADQVGNVAQFWEFATPGQVVSYKIHCKPNRQIPNDARVVCYHGRPKPADVKDKWMVELRKQFYPKAA